MRPLTIAHLGDIDARSGPYFAGVVANLLSDLRRIRPALILLPGRLTADRFPSRAVRRIVYDLVAYLGHLAPTVLLAADDHEWEEWEVLGKLRTMNAVHVVAEPRWIDMGRLGRPLGVACLDSHEGLAREAQEVGGIALGLTRDLRQDDAESWYLLDYTACAAVPEWATDRVLSMGPGHSARTHMGARVYHLDRVARSGALVTTLEREPDGPSLLFTHLTPRTT